MMNRKMLWAASLVLGAAAALGASAQEPRNPMSVHVLDQQTGLPVEGMQVSLAEPKGSDWVIVSRQKTDADGRVAGLYPQGQALRNGHYRVVFETGSWYQALGRPTFYPEVDVVINVDGSVPHYHVPLLLSAYGYSTYRGS